MTVGDRIKERLKYLGMSQQALADKVGVRQPTINGLITGGSQGSKHLHKIAVALQTTVEYLECEIDDPDENASWSRTLTRAA